MNYTDFLKSKVVVAPKSGFAIDRGQLNPELKGHQKDAVQWAIAGGRRALFESFGLGKTAQEIEFCHQVVMHERVNDNPNAKALIVLPLGVKQEFSRDAVALLHYEAPPYVRTQAEADAYDGEIVMTNYERVRDGDIDPKKFCAVALDEASVLRSFGSKTYQTFLQKFRGVKYKLVCTATPSPNRYKELIHYAAFLEVMDSGQALTRFFQRDSTKANHLTLYPHKEQEFWLWVASWALLISKPSDLGYRDEGYDLPKLTVNWHELSVDHSSAGTDKFGQVKLIRDASVSIQDEAREKRESLNVRVAKMAEIVNSAPEDHFILWHDLESERHAIKDALPEAVEVYGTQDLDERERRVVDFSEGRTRLLATKKEISGQGCNFQRYCHRAIFLGIDYKFNDFIQAVHRIYRFLQTEEVVIDIIYVESEAQVKEHRYLFLTKNPKRYIKLIQAGILPLNNDRFWYGTTCENPMQEYFFCGRAKTFVSIEPIFAPFTGLNYFDTPPEQRVDWIIVGAETGNRKGKVIPEKSWIDELAYCSAQQKTPIFMKSSLRGIMGVDFVQQFPWDK